MLINRSIILNYTILIEEIKGKTRKKTVIGEKMIDDFFYNICYNCLNYENEAFYFKN